MIVTIDGPAGAGKSTVARSLARRLGFAFLDTGAMYRAVTYAAMRDDIGRDDLTRLRELVTTSAITFAGERTLLNGEDVTHSIRQPDVTRSVARYADLAVVRDFLVQQQRQAGEGIDLVTEGRDQGTVVFPDAACKFFLTASQEARARRRVADYAAQGISADLNEVLADLIRRDHLDSSRVLAPLKPAADADTIDTTLLTTEAVIDLLESRVRERAAML